MKNLSVSEWFGGAGKCVTQASSVGKRAIPVVALVLLLFALLSSSGCTGITSTPQSPSSQQGTSGAATISVAPASISFGSVAIGSTSSQSVTISNGGGSNLTVTQASTTAAGVTITGISLPLVIGSGKQFTFNVVFSPKAAGALSGNVSVMSDISSSPSAVSLRGTGMAATAFLTSSTSSLNFGNVSVGRSSALSVTLTNAGNSNITVSKVDVPGAFFSESGVSAGLILAPGQSATLDATFSPRFSGIFPGSVTVVSNATNSPAVVSLSGAGVQSASHSVALTWAPSRSAVLGYNVYRSTVSGGPYTKLNSSAITTTSYTDSDVQAGDTYYYVATSLSHSGAESADSTEVSAVIPTLVAVQISGELGSAITKTQHNSPFGFLRGGRVGHSEVLLLMDAVEVRPSEIS